MYDWYGLHFHDSFMQLLADNWPSSMNRDQTITSHFPAVHHHQGSIRPHFCRGLNHPSAVASPSKVLAESSSIPSIIHTFNLTVGADATTLKATFNPGVIIFRVAEQEKFAILQVLTVIDY